jgi:hemoglobin
MSQPESAGPTLYERAGGADALRLAVENFYAAVLADPALAPYFAGHDVSDIKRHQVLLLTQLLGGPAGYTGRELGPAHAGLQITDEDYDRVARHLEQTLVGLGVEADVVAAVNAAVAGVRADIVTAPSTDTALPTG